MLLPSEKLSWVTNFVDVQKLYEQNDYLCLFLCQSARVSLWLSRRSFTSSKPTILLSLFKTVPLSHWWQVLGCRIFAGLLIVGHNDLDITHASADSWLQGGSSGFIIFPWLARSNRPWNALSFTSDQYLHRARRNKHRGLCLESVLNERWEKKREKILARWKYMS